MLAVLLLPAYWLIKHPELLVVAETPRIGGSLHGDVIPDAGSPTEPMLALSPTPVDAGTFIIVTADTVNLRDDAGNATGLYLYAGNRIVVSWDGNWGLIVQPKSLSGYRVWRGCTSDAGTLGCEAK